MSSDNLAYKWNKLTKDKIKLLMKCNVGDLKTAKYKKKNNLKRLQIMEKAQQLISEQRAITGTVHDLLLPFSPIVYKALLIAHVITSH